MLVPGFWLGAWAWDEVATDLRGRGLDVVAVTLPGLDGSSTSAIGLDDHAQAIRDALDDQAERRVLVVHSGAAFPATMLIDQSPGLVDRLILVDTAIPVDQTAFNADQVGDFTVEQAWDDLLAEGSLAGLTAEQLTTFRERALPQPHGVVTQAISLSNPERFRVPVTTICTAVDSSAYQEYAAQGVPFLAGLLDHQVDYVDLPTGHWPMWSKPTELASVIAQAASS